MSFSCPFFRQHQFVQKECDDQHLFISDIAYPSFLTLANILLSTFFAHLDVEKTPRQFDIGVTPTAHESNSRFKVRDSRFEVRGSGLGFDPSTCSGPQPDRVGGSRSMLEVGR